MEMNRADFLLLADDEIKDSLGALLDRAHKRGDGVAAYENKAMNSHTLGHIKFVSYGSPEAQIPGTPTTRMPDIGKDINHRYVLIGLCPPPPV